MSTATHERSESGEHPGEDDDHGGGSPMQKRMYLRFAAMIATSTVVMFGLMYSNVYSASHVHWSEERFYMALLMGGTMTVIMMGFMWGMYQDTKRNVGILLAGVAVFAGALWLSRSQFFVDDQAYMQGMIPHHSIAILTSERADIDDVRVRELANQINEAQRVEIAEMEWLIQDIEENGPATTEAEAAERPIPHFEAESWRESADN